MTLYMVDSTVLIQFARGRPRETRWLQTYMNSRDRAGTCAVQVAECYAGARPEERAGWAEIFASLVEWPVTHEDAAQSGIYRYESARRGLQLKLGDTLIAAIARRLGATVVTDNIKDYPMEDIVVIRPD